MTAAVPRPPQVEAGLVHLRLEHIPGVTAVELECDRAISSSRAFHRTHDGGWVLDLAMPPVQRLEYRFVVTRRHRVTRILDPSNPALVAGPAGPRSVLQVAGYAAPSWAEGPDPAGRFDPWRVTGSTCEPVPVTVWSPAGLDPDEPAGLVVVNDGPEYSEYGAIVRFSAHGMADGSLPPHRLALLHPPKREDWYSGSPAYLQTLTGPVLDSLLDTYAVRSPVVMMGASLGGLTALLAGLADTTGSGSGRVGAVFAQSGSFFTRRTDLQERGFRYFARIAALVQSVHGMSAVARPLVIGMTCGALEENAANNRVMAEALQRVGHDVTYREVADLHTFTAWRDSLAPTLAQVLRRAWQPGPWTNLAARVTDH